MNPIASRTTSLVVVGLILVSFLQTMPIALPQGSQQPARIQLWLSTDRPLRGQILVVSGRLSSVSNNLPIPLVSVRLQYFRVGDTNATRDVTMITNSPSGRFQDLVNTTYLLRIGPWIVNASFTPQLVYQAASAVQSFTVVVQPALSLYVYPHQVTLGQEVDFNGLLFACIPCLNDNVTVELIRPNNTYIVVPLRLNATGGPYPGGYYDAKFMPDTPGEWHVMAIWAGNEVSLPTNSTVEALFVEAPGSMQSGPMELLPYAVILLVAVVVIALLKRRGGKKTRRESNAV